MFNVYRYLYHLSKDNCTGRRTPPGYYISYMPLISSTEAAKRLKITPSLVARYIREGRLKAIKVGKTWCIEERDVERFPKRELGRPPEK